MQVYTLLTACSSEISSEDYEVQSENLSADEFGMYVSKKGNIYQLLNQLDNDELSNCTYITLLEAYNKKSDNLAHSEVKGIYQPQIVNRKFEDDEIIALLSLDNFNIETTLLYNQNFSTDQFILFLENCQKVNLAYYENSDFLITKFSDMELTDEQLLQILNLKNWDIDKHLLFNSTFDLAQMLLFIENAQCINFKYTAHSNYIFDFISNLGPDEMTEDQYDELSELDMYIVDSALKEREVLLFQESIK